MIMAMMRAARDYVREKMIEDEILAASFKELSELGGDPPDIGTLPEGYALYEVRATIEDSPEPKERHVVYVKCREIAGDLEGLKDWMIEICVATPGDVTANGISLDGMMALELAVARIWDRRLHPTAEADLAAQIEAKAPGYTGGGFYPQGWTETQDDNGRFPVFEVKAGVKWDTL